MRVSGVLSLACLLCACSSSGAELAPAEGPQIACDVRDRLTFLPEIAADLSEAYVCYAFDAAPVAGAAIQSLIWTDPQGGTALHHATLYATSTALPANTVVPCDPMPADATALHVWAPGGSQLEMPPGIGLALPANTVSFLVEAHIRRLLVRPAGTASVDVCSYRDAPPTLAARLGLGAPVPTIPPHMTVSSSADCHFSLDFQLLFAWPHMHVTGQEFVATLQHGASSHAILDVNPWDFSHQWTYAVSDALTPGDVITTTCEWNNPGDAAVEPGVFTFNEMCTFSLFGYPAENASCQ